MQVARRSCGRRAGLLPLLALLAAALLALAACAGSSAAAGPRVLVLHVTEPMHEPVWSDGDGVLVGLTETGSRVEKVDPARGGRSQLSSSLPDVGRNLAAGLPDTGLVYVPEPQSGTIAAVRVSDLRQIRTLHDGPSPSYLATDVGASVLLSLSSSGVTVTGMNLPDGGVVTAHQVNAGPDGKVDGPQRGRVVDYHVTGPRGVAHYKHGGLNGAVNIRATDAVGDQTKTTRLYVAEAGTDRLVAVDSNRWSEGMRVVGSASLGAPVRYVGQDAYRVYAATDDRLVVLATNSFRGYESGRIPILATIGFRAGLPAALRDAAVSGLAVGPHRVYLTLSGQPDVLAIAKPSI